MSTPIRRLTQLLALLLCAGLVLGGPIPSLAATDGGEQPPPPLKVTVSGVSTPRYGDNLTFAVASTGQEVVVEVEYGGTTLASKPLDDSRTSFSIPTAPRFAAGGSYRLQIHAANALGQQGNATVAFDVTTTAATITLSRTTFSYRTPLFGAVTANAGPLDTILSPGEIDVYLDGALLASDTVRTDGTFGVRLPSVTPGSHDVEVRLQGANGWVAPPVGARLTITKVPTALALTLDDNAIDAGDPVTAELTVTATDPDTDAPLAGTAVLLAKGPGETAYTEIGRGPIQRNQRTPFDLTDFFADKDGAWEVQARFQGGDLAEDAVASAPLGVAGTTPPPGGGQVPDGQQPGGTDPAAHDQPAATTTQVVRTKLLKKHRVRLVVRVSAPVTAAGEVIVRLGKRIVARGTLSGGQVRLTTKRLPHRKLRLTVLYLGAPGLLASAAPVKVRVR